MNPETVSTVAIIISFGSAYYAYRQSQLARTANDLAENANKIATDSLNEVKRAAGQEQVTQAVISALNLLQNAMDQAQLQQFDEAAEILRTPQGYMLVILPDEARTMYISILNLIVQMKVVSNRIYGGFATDEVVRESEHLLEQLHDQLNAKRPKVEKGFREIIHG